MALYRKILVALENSGADRSLLPHISVLARTLGSELLLLHVADGWVARNFKQLHLSESPEIQADRAYLEKTVQELQAAGLNASALLALGDPATEILKTAAAERCDLIAMASHGHRWVADVVLGSTIREVRHNTSIPVLLVRAGT